MKVTDLAIAFILIILPSTLILDYKTMDTALAVYENVKIGKILDAAVDDAAHNIFSKGVSDRAPVDIEKGYETFMETLLRNFRMIDDEIGRRTIEGYIPCLAVIDYDGYYIMKHVEYQKWDGHGIVSEIRMAWMPKRAFSYSDDRYVYSLTLGNDIIAYDKYTQQIYRDTADNFIADGTLPDSRLLADDPSTAGDALEDFDVRRRNAIIECLQKDIAYTINNHNNIAKYYGITYYFSIPAIEHDIWSRTIDDIGLVAFFQGMPMGSSGEYVNIFSLGGTRIFKASKYYLDIDGTPDAKLAGGLIYYYHTAEDCPYLNPSPSFRPPEGYPMRDTAKECASEGYFPCEHCS